MTWVPLKRVADVWPSNVDKLTVEGERPVRLVNYTDVSYGDRLHPGLDLMKATATPAEISKFRVHPGDVILTKDSETPDDIGLCAYVDEAAPDMVCGYHLSLVRPRRAVGRYLHYAISSSHARHQMTAAATGVTRFGLRAESVGSLSVWLPSEAEQRAIADYLDAETARIDALIAKKQQLIHLLEERFSAVVERELGSSSWPRLRLKHVCNGITVGVVVNPSSYFVEDGVPFIHGTDIRRGWIDTSQLKFLSAESNAQLRKSQVRAGDVVAMRVGEPGRAAVVPPELDGSNCASVLILRHADVLEPRLLSYFLNSASGRTQIEAVQYGAAQGVMNVGDAVDLIVPVPPTRAQEMLLSTLDRAERRFGDAAGILRRQTALLSEHRQALITAVVTGELALPEAA